MDIDVDIEIDFLHPLEFLKLASLDLPPASYASAFRCWWLKFCALITQRLVLLTHGLNGLKLIFQLHVPYKGCSYSQIKFILVLHSESRHW